MTPTDLAHHIEHTRLKADTTVADIERLCVEAQQHGFVAVCVNPIFIACATKALQTSSVKVVTVVGFPLGAALPRVLAHEARCAVAEGASEIDMVVPIGAALGADWAAVTEHVRAVRDQIGDRVLKVILETGYFNANQLKSCAMAALQGGPQYLKTSTGFGPRGASVDDVKQLCELCPPGVAVKASGGIRTQGEALALIEAGATRLGTSNGVAIVSENVTATCGY